jgi:hypothetical protein
MEVLVDLPHLQTVVDVGHSVQFPFLCFSLQFYVVFSFSGIQYMIIARQYHIMGWSILPNDVILAKGLACGFGLPPSNNGWPKGKSGLHSNTVWYY